MNNMILMIYFVWMLVDENSKMRKEKVKIWKWMDWKADNIIKVSLIDCIIDSM